jgi:hypothetical protein
MMTKTVEQEEMEFYAWLDSIKGEFGSLELFSVQNHFIIGFNLIRQFKEHNLKQAQYSNSMLNKETLTREQKQ